MIKFRFYNKTAVLEGHSKEEYCSEWYSYYAVALKFMYEQMANDASLNIYDEYEIEMMEIKTIQLDPNNLPEKYKEQLKSYETLIHTS